MQNNFELPLIHHKEWYKLWWIHFPLRVNQLSTSVGQVLLDGYYLLVWKPIASILPPFLFVLGIMWGIFNWGYNIIFSESRFFLLFIISLGVLSGQLGFIFLVGFIIGDFFWDDHNLTGSGNYFSNFFLERFPLLIKYSLLWALVTYMPIFTKLLAAQIKLPQKVPLLFQVVLSGFIYLVLIIFFIYYWAQVAPILIRSVFSWQGLVSSNSSPYYILQNETFVLVEMGFVVALIRLILQYLTVTYLPFKKEIDVYEQLLLKEKEGYPIPKRQGILPWTKVLLFTSWMLLLLSGLYTTWLEPLLLGVLMITLYAAQRNLINLPIDDWKGFINRFPLLLRLVVMIGLIYVFNELIVESAWDSNTALFRPILYTVGMTIVLFYIFNPGVSIKKVS